METKTISTAHGAIKQTARQDVWRFEFTDMPQLNGDYECYSEKEAVNRYLAIVEESK